MGYGSPIFVIVLMVGKQKLSEFDLQHQTCDMKALSQYHNFVQATAEATRNIYKEVADRALGLPPKGGACKAGDASCYDHTNNTGIGQVRVSRAYPPPEKSPYNYAEVLHKSFIFYYQQRSGPMNPQVHLQRIMPDIASFMHQMSQLISLVHIMECIPSSCRGIAW